MAAEGTTNFIAPQAGSAAFGIPKQKTTASGSPPPSQCPFSPTSTHGSPPLSRQKACPAITVLLLRRAQRLPHEL
jgi:hypothetical protein